MEAVGLAIGIAGLASLFNTCVDSYNRFEVYRKYGSQSQRVMNLLESQNFFFQEWARGVGMRGDQLLDNHHPRLDDKETMDFVVRTVALISEDLRLISKHFDLTLTQPTDNGIASRAGEKYGRFRPAQPSYPPKNSFRKGLKWAVGKDELIDQLENLEKMIESLARRVPVDNPKSSRIDSLLGSNPPAYRAGGPPEFSEEQIKEQRYRLKRWLDGSRPTPFLNQLRECRAKDTCQWILENDQYQQWLDSPNVLSHSNTLWLHGLPGFGKSVLSSFLVDELSTSSKNIAHFFCSSTSTEESASKPSSILRTCMTQALKDPRVLRRAHEIMEDSDSQTASDADLWTLLEDILDSQIPLTLIIDGFDECEEYESESSRRFGYGRSSFLEKLHRCFNDTTGRLLVVSRDVYDIGRPLGCKTEGLSDLRPACEYKIREEDVGSDVRRFADVMVRNKLPRNSQKGAIAGHLAKKGRGMFLWVKLMSDDLKPTQSTAQISQNISKMPTELSGIYEEEWQRVIDSPRNMELLRWTIASFRPLTISELLQALAVEERAELKLMKSSSFSDDIKDEPIDDQSLADELLGYCGIFVEHRQTGESLDITQDFIQTTHFTAKSFLISKMADVLDETTYQNHSNHLAAVCLGFLIQFFPPQGLSEQPNCPKEFSFYNYCALKWSRHALPAKESFDKVEDAAKDFFHEHSDPWKAWRTTYESDPDGPALVNSEILLEDSGFVSTFDPGHVTYYAAQFGLNETLKHIEGRGALEVNRTGGLFGTPLQAASFRGLHETVLFLIQRGADVNMDSGGFSSALSAAAYSRSSIVVGTLLENGANVNFRNKAGLTALHWASYRGELDIVQQLLKAGASVDLLDNFNRTPLYFASFQGHQSVIKYLLARNAALSITRGLDTLIAASESGHFAVVKMLIEAGARPDHVENDGKTAIHVATTNKHLETVRVLLSTGAQKLEQKYLERTPLQLTAINGSTDIAELLLAAGADISALTSTRRYSLIHCAALSQHTEMVRLLIAKGCSVNTRDMFGRTAIHEACEQGNETIVELLLSSGAEHGVPELQYGLTPIYLSAMAGNLNIIKMLCAKGADVNQKTQWYKQTPTFAAAANGHADALTYMQDHCGADAWIPSSDGYLPIHQAAYVGDLAIIKRILEHWSSRDRTAGETLDVAEDGGWTPLHIAVRNGHTEVVRYLVDKGADVNLGRHHGKNSAISPLQTAIKIKHFEIFRLLVEGGADINYEGSYHQHGIFDSALRTGDARFVQLLIDHGMDINAYELDDESLLQRASRTCTLEILELLLANGAEIPIEDDEREKLLALATANNTSNVLRYLLDKIPLQKTFYGGEEEYAYSLRSTALMSNDPDAVHALVQAGFELFRKDHLGRTALHATIDEANLRYLREIPEIESRMAAVDELGCTTLHYIVRQSPAAAVEWAVSTGIDVNKQDHQGWTPLHWAAYGDNIEATNTLLQRGADRTLVDFCARSPGYVALFCGHRSVANFLLSPVQQQNYQPGSRLRGACDACGHCLIGVQMHCVTCLVRIGYDLCFRCFPDKDRVHYTSHIFRNDFRYE